MAIYNIDCINEFGILKKKEKTFDSKHDRDQYISKIKLLAREFARDCNGKLRPYLERNYDKCLEGWDDDKSIGHYEYNEENGEEEFIVDKEIEKCPTNFTMSIKKEFESSDKKYHIIFEYSKNVDKRVKPIFGWFMHIEFSNILENDKVLGNKLYTTPKNDENMWEFEIVFNKIKE